MKVLAWEVHPILGIMHAMDDSHPILLIGGKD
jgi:hypothetical protein